MSHFLKSGLGIALAVLLTGATTAQEVTEDVTAEARRYNVEFIVFSYSENVSVGTEVFPPDTPEVDLDQLAFGPAEQIPEYGDPALSEPAADDTSLPEGEAPIEDGPSLIDAVLLLDDERSMQRAHSQLVRLDAYEPLLYTGWSQLALAPKDTKPIELTFFGRVPPGLAGSFKLYMSRFLHLVVDLTLDDGESPAEPAPYAEPAFSFGDERVGFDTSPVRAPGPVRFRIEEDRIIKNGDIRYFDHPKFGIVVKVTRVDPPEPGEQPADDIGPLTPIGVTSQ
jgi:hypothetical protein